jgi:hypothetical protein
MGYYTLQQVKELEKTLNVPDGVNFLEYVANLEDFKNEVVVVIKSFGDVLQDIVDSIE